MLTKIKYVYTGGSKTVQDDEIENHPNVKEETVCDKQV